MDRLEHIPAPWPVNFDRLSNTLAFDPNRGETARRDVLLGLPIRGFQSLLLQSIRFRWQLCRPMGDVTQNE